MATYPEQYDVRDGIVYGPNDNDFTGNLTLPAVGDVTNGTTFGGNGGIDDTGTFVVPIENNVANGTQYGAGGTEFTGDLLIPEATDIRSGVAYGPAGASVGNLLVPEQYDVLDGVEYGSLDPFREFTGNLTLPEVYQVSNGTTFGGNGGADFTGNATFPAEGDVANGTQYGGNGTEFTGSLTGLFSATDAAKLDAIYDKLPTSDYLAGSDEADGSISSGGSAAMLTLDITSVLASTAPLTLPAATTSLSALMTANNLTFNNATIALYLQPQNGTMYLDPAGSNATANGTIVEENQLLKISKAANNNDTNLGSIHLARGAAGATVKVICQ